MKLKQYISPMTYTTQPTPAGPRVYITQITGSRRQQYSPSLEIFLV